MTESEILEEIKQMKKELKSSIEALEVRIALGVQEINRRVIELEKENSLLKKQLELQEQRHRENNIIIFGLKHPQHNLSAEFVRNELKNLVGIEVKESDLNNFYPLGKTDSCPIKVEFVSFLKKKSILNSAKKLKGSNIFIGKDLTSKERQDNQILGKHLRLAKQDQNINCFIRNNRLHVDNKIYTVEDLEGTEEIEEISVKHKPNSAPGTPTPSSHDSYRELLKNNDKPSTSIEHKQSKRPPISSPAPQNTGTIRKDTKRKEADDKPRVETRSNKFTKK